MLTRYQIGVFSLPPGAGARCQWLFHQRGGIDKHLYSRTTFRRKLSGKLLQLALDHVMIVAAARINRDIATANGAQIIHRVMIGAVIHQGNNGGTRICPHSDRLATAVRCFAQPDHVTFKPVSQKSVKPRTCTVIKARICHINFGKASGLPSIVKPAAETRRLHYPVPIGSISPRACPAWKSASNAAKLPASMAARMPAIRS